MTYRTDRVISQASRPFSIGRCSNMSASDDLGTREQLAGDGPLGEATHESLVIFTERRQLSCLGDIDFRPVPMTV